MRFPHLSVWIARGMTGMALAALVLSAALGALASPGAIPIGANETGVEIPASPSAIYTEPTTSSPIALSNDKAWVWVVNPDDDSVSVINASTDALVFRLPVGDEPQSIALDPDGEYAYVASAADNSVTVIRVTNTNPFAAVVEEKFVTGAEPWNIVISPDGKRVYVANSAQDTITVIRADVNYPTLPSIIGNVTLDNTACNVGDANLHFQPRGLAVTVGNNPKVYVTRFLSFVKTGGKQANNIGKEGIVCRLDVDTSALTIGGSVTGYTPIALGPHDSGFNGEFAYPNQLQSIVLRGDRAYLPNIAVAPDAPLSFNADTHAFVNMVNGAAGGLPSDGGALNLHLGARVPEAGKTRLFFANVWAMVFSNQSGNGNAYVVSAGSDLVVKLNVDASGALTFTNGVSTTRYIDLNDPNDPATSARNAGKNPLGIVLRNIGPGNNKAYVMNYISRNVSVINLDTDSVSGVINLANLPIPNTLDEQLQVGKEVFFSSRGNFDRPGGTTVSTANRLSSDGWQACASCHFAGLTDGTVWRFATGPRKSVPLNSTWSPHNPNDQRILNYSAILDEVEDFELNIRNVSGPGALTTPINGSTFDPNHGLLISDTGDINTAPLVVNAFAKANGGRPQLSVTLPGSSTAWPALTALKEWVRLGIRTPNGMLTTGELAAGGGSTIGGLNPTDVALGRRLFFQAGCATCHGGTKWTVSNKDFASPPASSEIATENPPITTTVNTQYLPRFLSNINSFNLGVLGGGNPLGGNIGAIEKAANGQDALGKDYDGNSTGNGYNIPSLLGIWQMPPYYHNGACETLECVLGDVTHRTRGTPIDVLSIASRRTQVVTFLKTVDDQTVFPLDLSVNRHDIFFDPPTVFRGHTVVVGANISLFGVTTDLADLMTDLGVSNLTARFDLATSGRTTNITVTFPITAFKQNFGQAVVTTTWNVPADSGVLGTVVVRVDPANQILEANKSNNIASRLVLLRTPPPDATPPIVSLTRLSDDTPFNDNDPLTPSRNVRVKIVATDPPGPPPAPTSGLDSYCLVRYFYSVALRRWVEEPCAFQPLPAPEPATTDTFIISTTIPPREGVAYAFAWVKDRAGNISRVPGFDVISFVPTSPIDLTRNDIDLYRIPLTAGQVVTFSFTPLFGDVDVAVFDNFTSPNANRIALSANNGALTETVTLVGPGLRQIEVRAIVNSRYIITFTQGISPALAMDAWAADTPTLADADAPTLPLIAGPPALQTAIGEPEMIYLPIVMREP